ncbi:MAG: hypothetical protein ACLR23_22820 [Clostridia bacterium]
MKVLVEGQIPGEEGYVYSTRTYRDAPDIDGFFIFEGDAVSVIWGSGGL